MELKGNAQTKEQKLVQFIRDNGLKFTEGRRNSDAVIISGFALHLGFTSSDDLVDLIDEAIDNTGDDNYWEELCRVFDFANCHNYGAWWGTEEARKQYKF